MPMPSRRSRTTGVSRAFPLSSRVALILSAAGTLLDRAKARKPSGAQHLDVVDVHLTSGCPEAGNRRVVVDPGAQVRRNRVAGLDPVSAAPTRLDLERVGAEALAELAGVGEVPVPVEVCADPDVAALLAIGVADVERKAGPEVRLRRYRPQYARVGDRPAREALPEDPAAVVGVQLEH